MIVHTRSLSLVIFGLALALSSLGCGGEEKLVTACGAVCEIGTTTCEGDVVVRCEAGVGGCPVPVVEVCALDEVCGAADEADEVSCVARDCSDEDTCTIGETGCADETTATICIEGVDGCGALAESICGDGSVCVDGACVGACVDSDGDGFGRGCEAGDDCDDGDPLINPDAMEVCDDLDNNCDGDTDEGFDGKGDPCNEGVGACEAEGKLICNDQGDGLACDAAPGAPGELDLCDNGLDDDCDGDTDEDHPDLGGDCTAGLGVCGVPGVFVCGQDGLALDCDGTPGEPEEADICNGLDDDCDGEVDEDFPGLGGGCTAGLGICAVDGVFVCNEGGDGIVCEGQEGQGLEIDLCGNGLDDDCDGEVDEGFPTLGALCEVGEGACLAVGVEICAIDGLDTVCSAEPGEEGDEELCGDGVDNNCNGEVDEGFNLLGTACEVGEGACGNQGARVCSQDRLALVCGAQEGFAGDEICDGIDNDCNGTPDDGFDVGVECTVGQGICERTGVTICAGDGLDTVCNVRAGDPAPGELCGNGEDDDCDGGVDEGFSTVGDDCTEGLGECADDGTVVCSNDLQDVVCDAEPGEQAIELCNGLDENCDGIVDGPIACGACEEDIFEPNDTIDQAAPIADGDRFEGSICFFNRDFYSLGQLESGGVILNVRFFHDQGDIDVAVFRDGEFAPNVTGGVSTNDNEQVLIPILEPGDYSFLLGVVDGGGIVDYTLSVMSGINLCEEDVFEHDDTPETAVFLAPDEPRAMVGCSDDFEAGGDWFDLGQRLRDTRLDLLLQFSHQQANLDAFVLDEDGVVIASGESANNDESFVAITPRDGRYFLQVVARGDGDRAAYTVRYAVEDGFCEDDRFEDNDTPNDTVTLNEGISAPAKACAGDDDWYLLNTIYEPGEVVQINAVFDRRDGDLDIELFELNEGLELVAFGVSSGDNESIRHVTTGDGIYFARIFAVDGQPSYKVSHVPRRQDTCVPDEFEVDGFLDVATPGVPGRTYGMVACPNIGNAVEFDLMALGELQPGQSIQSTITFTHARGDLALLLISFDGVDVETVAVAQTADDDEQLFEAIVEQNNYFLGIQTVGGDGGPGNPYRLIYRVFE